METPDLPEVRDEVTWICATGYAKPCRATVQKILQTPDGPAVWVDWFGMKAIPMKDVTLVRKSTSRQGRELAEANRLRREQP